MCGTQWQQLNMILSWRFVERKKKEVEDKARLGHHLAGYLFRFQKNETSIVRSPGSDERNVRAKRNRRRSQIEYPPSDHLPFSYSVIASTHHLYPEMSCSDINFVQFSYVLITIQSFSIIICPYTVSRRIIRLLFIKYIKNLILCQL